MFEGKFVVTAKTEEQRHDIKYFQRKEDWKLNLNIIMFKLNVLPMQLW